MFGTVFSCTLKWPPSTLSPNKRLHWARVAKEKRLYREECRLESVKVINGEKGGENVKKNVHSSERLHLFLSFIPPDKRQYDRDNLVARMKSGIDGVADALSINDVKFHYVTAEMVDCRPIKPGFVMLRIESVPVVNNLYHMGLV